MQKKRPSPPLVYSRCKVFNGLSPTFPSGRAGQLQDTAMVEGFISLLWRWHVEWDRPGLSAGEMPAAYPVTVSGCPLAA